MICYLSDENWSEILVGGFLVFDVINSCNLCNLFLVVGIRVLRNVILCYGFFFYFLSA